MKKLRNLIKWLIGFITYDIWRIRLSDLPKSRSFLLRQLRIIILAIKGFRDDKCQLQASALTYYSLMAIVPVLAMMFGIAKGFGFEGRLEAFITEKLDGHQEVIDHVLEFTHSMIESTKGGVIAGIGLVLLFWSVMQLLSSIEHSFNDIWEVKKARRFLRKFSDYISIMLIAPVMIIMSSSLTVFISTQLVALSRDVEVVGAISPMLFGILRYTPYILIWLLLTIIYMIMPNTNVKFKNALMAGIIAGSLYQVAQYYYFLFQMTLSSYNAIYGSFAALPLLLIWLQISWLIILFGAEISFAAQNVSRFEFEKDSMQISNSFRQKVALLISHKITKTFINGEKPPTSSQLSLELKIPIRIVRRVLFELVECGVLSEVVIETYKETAYQPASDINRFTVKYILDAVNNHGVDDIEIRDTRERQTIEEAMKNFGEVIKTSPGNKKLKDI